MNKEIRAEKEKEFIRMIRDSERIIYKVCSLYVSGDFPLEDLYQEVVLNLWIAFHRFRSESSRATYIYRIALNTCISALRSARRKPRTEPLSFSIEPAFEPDHLEEEIRELYALIRRLKTLERAVILLWLEEKPYQEIADVTGLSVANVATKLKRIKEKLKTISNN
jgi:RNA polymerase sigma-70 factor (ECF subfamily)